MAADALVAHDDAAWALAPSLAPPALHATNALSAARAGNFRDMAAHAVRLRLAVGTRACGAERDACFVYVADLWRKRLRRQVRDAAAAKPSFGADAVAAKPFGADALLSLLRWTAVAQARQAGAPPAVASLGAVAEHVGGDAAGGEADSVSFTALRRALAHMPPVVPCKRFLGELKGYVFGVRRVRLGNDGPPRGAAVLGYHADVSSLQQADAAGPWGAHAPRVCGQDLQDALAKLVSKATGHRPRELAGGGAAALIAVDDRSRVPEALAAARAAGARAVCVLGGGGGGGGGGAEAPAEVGAGWATWLIIPDRTEG